MSDERKSIAEIEAELERQRQALNANLSALKDRMSPGGLARDAMGLLNLPAPEAATGMIASLSATVRANPVAAAAAGAGLLWLVSRPARGRKTKVAQVASAPVKSSSLGTAISAATALANVVAAMEPDQIRAVTAEVDRIARAGAAKVREIDASLRQGADDLREGAREAKEAASEKVQSARDATADKVQTALGAAAEAKAKLGSGLESLSDGAASAAAAARAGAVRAKHKAKGKADDAYAEVAGLVERHPIAAGAGAAATGALIAVLLAASSGQQKGPRSG